MARERLTGNLSARKIVDFRGPMGMDFGAVPTGRAVACEKGHGGVQCCMREVLPMVEMRVPFTLSISELDNAVRGARDVDWENLEQAAMKAAHFEEDAVYNGLACAPSPGILAASTNKALTLPSAMDKYTDVVGEAMLALQTAGMAEPYTLVLGSKAFKPMNTALPSGRTLKAVTQELIGGQVLWSPALTGGVLVAPGEDSFELTVGQDMSVGYTRHEGDEVHLFFVETFAFRVLEPRAAVELKLKAK